MNKAALDHSEWDQQGLNETGLNRPELQNGSGYQVFVYGTLRKHESNHQFLQTSRLICDQCWTYGQLYDTGYGYPAMIQHETSRVYGELYEVDADTLDQLNGLEGYYGEVQDNHYERITQRIYTEHGEHKAYVYIYLPHRIKNMEMIPSGDWK